MLHRSFCTDFCSELNSGRWVVIPKLPISDAHEEWWGIASALPGWLWYIDSFSQPPFSVRRGQLLLAKCDSGLIVSSSYALLPTAWCVSPCFKCNDCNTPFYPKVWNCQIHSPQPCPCNNQSLCYWQAAFLKQYIPSSFHPFSFISSS